MDGLMLVQSLPLMQYQQASRDAQPSAPEGSVLIYIIGQILVCILLLVAGNDILTVGVVRRHYKPPDLLSGRSPRPRGWPVVHS